MSDDNTIRFTFRTLDTNLQKIKYIAGYNATSMNYEIDRQIKNISTVTPLTAKMFLGKQPYVPMKPLWIA